MSLFNGFKEKARKKLDNYANRDNNINKIPAYNQDLDGTMDKRDKFEDDFMNEDFNDTNFEDNINLMPSQKPESFHFFILDNQYQDLERTIRGVKDVYNKEKQQWEIKRKADHCFTDEESEDIVRTAQAYLSTDIKLGRISREEYPVIMLSIQKQLTKMFRSIMEYRFGRFGDYTKQYNMKLQAENILRILLLRIKSNYSRALEGYENKATHDSVKGQESLQHTERKELNRDYS